MKYKLNKCVGILVTSALLTSCYSSSELVKYPVNSDILASSTSTATEKPVLFVNGINTKLNGSESNSNADFERRFLSKIQQTGYFSEILYGFNVKQPIVSAGLLELTLNTNENIDLNDGSNVTKAFFTGLSLFLLAPILPARYDYDVSYNMKIKSDKGVKEYNSNCSGNAIGTWPYVSAVAELKKVSGQASDKCMIGVINQFTLGLKH